MVGATCDAQEGVVLRAREHDPRPRHAPTHGDVPTLPAKISAVRLLHHCRVPRQIEGWNRWLKACSIILRTEPARRKWREGMQKDD
jgi:hypothetical protein